MAIDHYDGFNTFATADILKVFDSTTGSPVIDATAGRRSAGALKVPSAASSGNVFKAFSANAQEIILSVNLNPSALPTADRNIIAFFDGATQQCSLRLNTSGTVSITRNGSTVLATSTATVDIAGDNFFEFKAIIDNTTGAYEVRLNEVNILSATSVDTQQTANAYATRYMLGTDLGGGTVTYTWSDFNVQIGSTLSFFGDARVDFKPLDGDGNYSDLTPSSGVDHYLLVDETVLDAGDNVSGSTVTNKDSFTTTAMATLASETIHAVRVISAMKKSDSGTRSAKLGFRSSTTDSVGSAIALSTSDVYYNEILETDPATAAAWIAAGVDAAEPIVEVA